MMQVVKIGGRAQSSPELANVIAQAWLERPGSMCLVHGGGDEVSTLQRAMGVVPSFIGGRRVTTEGDIDIIRMALSGSANKRLVAQLVGAGVSAVGISGEDGALMVASQTEDLALGAVGTPHRINVALCWTLLDAGFLPVVSPVARRAGVCQPGQSCALNVNGDDAAAALAVALAAEELMLVADVPGVLRDGVPAATLDVEEAEQLIVSGVAQGGMAAKLQAARAAIDGGVSRVRIGDVAAINERSRGTMIVPMGSAVA